MFHDVNGGWLPIVVSAFLGVAFGSQNSYISFGVVENMSVPAVLGTPFMDIATKIIATQAQHVELLNGTKVPIRRDGARKEHQVASVSAVCACPQGNTAKLRPFRTTWVQPGTIVHIPVNSTYMEHGFVTGRPSLYHKHEVQVSQGPSIMVAGEPLTVQVMQLGTTPLRLTTDMTVGNIDPYEGPTYEVSPNELKELDWTTKENKESPLPGLDVSPGPEEWSRALKALLKKHAPLWGGNLGLTRGVEYRIRLKPPAVPVRKHLYKAGSLDREREKAEIERMRSMGVIELATGEWDSLVAMVPTADFSVRFWIDH